MKMKVIIFLITFMLPLLSNDQIFSKEINLNSTELKAVERVEIERYLGKWYEIAKIPNRFQRKCTKNTTAT